MSTGPQELESQISSVPVDYVDPNHPHLPTDVKDQLPPRPYYRRINKKAVLVIIAIILVILSAVVGGKFGTDLAKRPLMKLAESEMQTVYSITTVFTTNPSASEKASELVSATTTSTQTSSLASGTTPRPTPTAPGANPPTPETPSKSTSLPILEPSKSKKQCFSTGRWPSLEACSERCAVNNKPGQEAHCEMDTNAVIKCVICKL
jgi:hypothetical protein